MTDLLPSTATGPAKARQRTRLRTEATELRVLPWPEAPDMGDRFPVRHPYVEAFYVATLGPTATLMLRRFGLGLAVHPQGYSVPVDYLAAALGLTEARGRDSALQRGLERLVWLRVAIWHSTDTLAVRQAVPRLHPTLVAKLPEAMQAEHAAALLAWERPQ